jgi:putative transposase
MGVAVLQKDARVRLGGVEHRLLRKVTNTCWQIENVKTKRVLEYETETLLKMYVDSELALVGGGSLHPTHAVHIGLSPEQLNLATLRRQYVVDTLDVPNTRRAMEPVIAETWRKLQQPNRAPGWGTVYAWKKRYLASRKDIRALTDNTYRKGNRKPRYPPELIALCEQALAKRYLTRERTTIQVALEEALIKAKGENRLRPESMALPTPTRRLMTRLIQKMPAFEKYAARFGPERARKEFRSMKGHCITNRPLERAEIDHTILDVFVLDDRTHLPLGRPYLTVCIDDFTRCVLGIYIGFQPPSFSSVAKCLKDCFRPKVKLREQYADIQNDWAAHGVMQELVVDNGTEFHSHSLEEMCGAVGIEIHYAPRQTPWFKGKVESFFRTVNSGFVHRIPGKTFSNIAERGDYDPTNHACITLAELNALTRKWIADVYHQTSHRALQTTPAVMWTTHMTPEDIPLPDESINLEAAAGSTARRMLTHKGIEYMGLIYNSPELTELRRREGHKLSVNIRVDECDIGKIYVLWPGSPEPYSVPALLSDYASGLSLWAHDVIRRQMRQQAHQGYDLPTLLESKRAIQQKIEEGFQLKRRKTRKRAGRFIEGAGRPAQPKVDKQSVTPDTTKTSGQSTAQDVVSAITVRDVDPPEGNWFDDEFTEEIPEFTARVKEEFRND